MGNRLAPRYARYGLLASLNLVAIEHLRHGANARPSRDDSQRLERLRDLLRASWQGGVVSGSISSPESKSHLSAPAGGSTRSKLDDADIVERAVPKGYVLEDFVKEADSTLDKVISSGLKDVDREFLDGALTDFLLYLARGNRGATSAAPRARRHRVPLA
jgi:hypothetical protein